MAKIISNINMFAFNNTIFLIDDKNISSVAAKPTIDELQDVLVGLINSNNSINEIELNGNDKFVEAIGYNLLKELSSKYSNRSVRVNINGKILN